jgi:hypothetical protein
MHRSTLLAILLGLLILVPGSGWSQGREIELSISETHPGLSGQIPLWGKLSIKLNYRATQSIRFRLEGYAGGQKVSMSSSNIMPSYPPGEGEALVWFASKDPRKIDEIRIVAMTSQLQPLATISSPVLLEWSSTAPSSPRTPAWYARLNKEQQDLSKQNAGPPSTSHTELGMLVVGIGGMSILGYIALQPFAVYRLRGRWWAHRGIASIDSGLISSTDSD